MKRPNPFLLFLPAMALFSAFARGGEIPVEPYSSYRGLPAFQWVVRVRNDGQTDSAKIHDFWGIDSYWNAADGSMPVLHRSVGSPGHEDDFHFMSEIMHNSMWDKRRRIPMDTPTNARWGQTHAYNLPADKRSSAHWLPLFNYQTGGDGLIAGLGWSGAWRAYFDHQGDGKSTILAGVENLDSILHPGESVRSTLNLVLYWQGEMMHGQNMFRRLVRDHYSPLIAGKLVEPPISGVVWGGIPSKEHLQIIEKIKQYRMASTGTRRISTSNRIPIWKPPRSRTVGG